MGFFPKDLWVMGRKSPPTELVDRKSYGIVEVMGLYRYGIRQVLLYMPMSNVRHRLPDPRGPCIQSPGNPRLSLLKLLSSQNILYIPNFLNITKKGKTFNGFRVFKLSTCQGPPWHS